MVILVGTVTVTIAGDARIVGAGDAVIIPAHTLHQVENSADAPAEWLLVAPAGVRFIHANGDIVSPPWAV